MQTVIEECLRFHYVCQISSFICNIRSACIERCLRNYSSFALLRFIIRSKGDHHPWRSWGSQSGQDKEITGTIETNESLQVNLGQLINCRLSRFCPIFYHHIPSNVKLLLGLRGWEITWAPVVHILRQLAFQLVSLSAAPSGSLELRIWFHKGVFPLMRRMSLCSRFSFCTAAVEFKIAAVSLKRSE